MSDTQTDELLRRITVNPGIFGGKAIIRGMRFRVINVLEMLASGMTREEILDEHPILEPDDITAALLFAAEAVRKDDAEKVLLVRKHENNPE